MLSIVATFENGAGKNRRLRINDVDPNKTAEEIKTSLEKLTTVSLFEKNGINLYQEVVGAKFIDKIETLIFDKKTDTTSEPISDKRIDEQPAEGLMIDPQKLIVEEKMLQPGVLMQRFELPEGLEPDEMSEQQALSLIMAIMPEGGKLEDISFEEGSSPARFQLIVNLKNQE
ncbi:DUF2922 domain-containing protein [Candidatus Enterococcus murrayae]|uniref:DUF2922 domain-containing protein n=1 Tax=Candidatus Enterococcus murrayae TaxID=2815321 RepID=A0ABS3HH33_9ENTE|nr:DUF2922 domain-containing protein [Enterococcus sp. MJM16]MBO0452751.1 DUF2922 domain-containing protein [Enterococcus sp. MJM16]